MHDQKKLNPLDLKHIEEYFLLHLLIKITMLLEQQLLLSLFKTNQGLYFHMKLYGVHCEDMNPVIHCNGKVPYFNCAALHSLCCPIQLELINVFEFYGNYEIVNKTRKMNMNC